MACASRMGMVVAASLVGLSCIQAAAPPGIASPRGKPADLYQQYKVWTMHLTVKPEDWAKMQPARGGFSRPQGKAPDYTDDRKPRGGFGYDFEYVRAGLVIDGCPLGDVGLRFKGNSTYLVAASNLKRPFKIDLDRYQKDRSFKGVRKLTLNNNVMDPTTARDVLAYGLYRSTGVPASRTSYAQVYLTVPGKYERTLIGLYTLIETVDRVFLEERFGSGKGMLLKPERVGPLDDLGNDWKQYESRYRPKSTPSRAAQKRFLEFIKLVHEADDARFRSAIGSYLDLDRFLRYMAVTVTLSSLDSFVGFGHNYYLYHDPKANRFVILPWDLDHSFGALTMLGNANDLIDLSIRRPYAGRNRLIERLLEDEATFATYTRHLQELRKTTFVPQRVHQEIRHLAAFLEPYRSQEKKAITSRGESWNTWTVLGLLNRPADIETFVTKRALSLDSQLAGKTPGTILRAGFGQRPGAERKLLRAIVDAADRDKDGKLTREEVQAGTRAFHAVCVGEPRQAITRERLQASLERLLPRPAPVKPGNVARPVVPGTPTAEMLTRILLTRAGQDGQLTEQGMLAAAERFFVRADRDRDGRLDAKELGEALRELLPPPQAAFGPAVERPRDPSKREKEKR